MARRARKAVLGRLPDEPFGHKMQRAREHANMTVREAEQETAFFGGIGYASISRLEQDKYPPSHPTRRRNAFLLCYVYRIDPAQVGLPAEEMDPGTVASAEAYLASVNNTPNTAVNG